MACNGEGKQSRVQVLDEFENSDLKAARNEYHFHTPFLVDTLSPLLKDQRDVPMLCLVLNIVLVLVPSVLFIYSLNLWEPPVPLFTRHVAGLLYVLMVFILFEERFILCLHFSSHRPIFHNATLNSILHWVFCPFFGVPCGLYNLHHVVMHHIENNHALDLSSTENYQRDSWKDFARYWLHFAVLIWYELPRYVVQSKRWNFLRSICIGMFAIWIPSICLLMKYVNFLATFWVFVVPHILAMSVLAFGNWSQHIFVNPARPESNYGLTYNCMDTKGNQTTFNDGYHVIHHLNARLHWTELPGYFHDNTQKHLENGALTFRGVHFFEVGIMVMFKQLGKLAQHYVHLGPKDTAPTVQEVEDRLRSWLKPVEPVKKKSPGAKEE